VPDVDANTPECTTVKIYYAHPTFSPLLLKLDPISVYPVGSAMDIKVGDIMNAIYIYFQQPITISVFRGKSKNKYLLGIATGFNRLEGMYALCWSTNYIIPKLLQINVHEP